MTAHLQLSFYMLALLHRGTRGPLRFAKQTWSFNMQYADLCPIRLYMVPPAYKWRPYNHRNPLMSAGIEHSKCMQSFPSAFGPLRPILRRKKALSCSSSRKACMFEWQCNQNIGPMDHHDSDRYLVPTFLLRHSRWAACRHLRKRARILCTVGCCKHSSL